MYFQQSRPTKTVLPVKRQSEMHPMPPPLGLMPQRDQGCYGVRGSCSIHTGTPLNAGMASFTLGLSVFRSMWKGWKAQKLEMTRHFPQDSCNLQEIYSQSHKGLKPAMLDLWYVNKFLKVICWFQTAVIDSWRNKVSCNYQVVAYAFSFEDYIIIDNDKKVMCL